MKNLLVITGLGMGGAEHVVVNLADALVVRGHHVKIAYLTGDALVFPNNANIEVVSIGMKGKGVKDFFKAYIKLRVLIKGFKPDVVHSHMIHANLLSRLVRLTAKVPKLVCTAHNTNEGGRLRMLAYRLTDKLANISTNVSEEAVEAFIKAGAVKSGRMVSVTNGIDTNRFVFDTKARDEKRIELNIDNLNNHDHKIRHCNIIIDALFGTGLNRPVSGFMEKVINKINQFERFKKFIISVDINSGVDSNSGQLIGPHVKSDLTLALAYLKQSHLLHPSAGIMQEVQLIDIGVPKKATEGQ